MSLPLPVRLSRPLLLLAITAAHAGPVMAAGQLHLDKGMVITATQSARSELQAPASVSVVTREQLEEQLVSNLADALQKVPGVNINPSSTYGRNEIKIRGMKADYTLLLVNGRRINSRDALTSAYANDFDLGSIPLAAIERIEVVRGAMSSLYGADALGGVVNVILRQPDEQFEGGLGYQLERLDEGEGGNAGKTSLYLGGPLITERLLGNLALERYQRSPWLSPQSLNARADALEDQDKFNLLSSFKWLLDERQDIDVDLTLNQDDRKADWNNWGATPRNIQELDRRSLGVAHNGRWEGFDSRVRYYLEQVDLRDDSALNRRVVDIEQTNHTWDAQGTLYLAEHLLTVGGEYRQTRLEQPMNLQQGAVEVEQSALYLQDEFNLGDFAFTLGARLDDHETYGSELSPRAYLTYSLSDQWVLKGGVAQAFKAPSIAQSDPSYAISSCRGLCSLVGNANLAPETATTYELGTQFQAATWGAGLMLFNNAIEDMIQADTWNRRPGAILTYRNVSRARVRGAELSGWVDLTERVSLSSDLTLVDATDRDTGKELTLTPEATFNLRLDWQLRDDLSSYLAYQHIGRQYVRVDERSSDYGTLDLGLSYSGIRDLQLQLGVTNLDNRSRDDAAQAYDYILKSRAVYAGATWQF